MALVGAGYCANRSFRVTQAPPRRIQPAFTNYLYPLNKCFDISHLSPVLIRALDADGRAALPNATHTAAATGEADDGAAAIDAAPRLATAARALPSPPPQSARPPSPPPPLPSDLLLSDIRVILVAPKHEANIGAVARACANFECVSLYLVAPRCAADPQGEARKVACGDAVLDRMKVTATLSDALADTAGSVGFTRRAGATRVTHASLGHLLAEFPWALPLQPPTTSLLQPQLQQSATSLSPPPASTAPQEAASAGSTASGTQGGGGGSGGGSNGSAGRPRPYVTALVFGREESGLTAAELRLCSHACAIPTGRLQPSMNLSHAVAVVLGEMFSRRCGLLNVESAEEVGRAAALVDGGGDKARLLQVPLTSSSSSSSSAASGSGRDCSILTAMATTVALGAAAAATAAVPGTVQATVGVSAGAEPGTGTAAAAVDGGVALAATASVDAGLLPASAQEVDLLLRKVAAVAEAVGMSGEESRGGGNAGNHGRRRLPLGHLRAVVSRARLSAAESRALHGLASGVLQRLNPEHPLEAPKLQRRKEER